MKKGILNRRTALAAGVAFALALSGMSAVPHSAYAETGFSAVDGSELVIETIGGNWADEIANIADNTNAKTVTITGAESRSNVLNTSIKQSDIDALATGTNTGTAENNNGVLIAAVVAAIAGLAGAAALVGNFFTAGQHN